MSRISRYVLVEVLKVFLVTLFGMTMVMIIAGALQEAVRRGLGVSPVMQLIPYVLPNALRFAVPGTMLFAACSVYGRMSAANEVVAVKAMGIHPMVVIWPTLILSFVISLVGVWLNDVAVSWGRVGVQRVVLESLEQIVYGMLRTGRSFADERFSITVVDVREHRLIRPTISFFGSDPDSTIMLKADWAELHFDPVEETLIIDMYNGRLKGDGLDYVANGLSREEVPLNFSAKKDQHAAPSHCALRRIPVEIKDQRDDIALKRELYAAEAGFQLLGGDFVALAAPEWNRRHHDLDQAQERLFRLYTEPWRRWANGFSCFFFVLIGAPLAIRMRNSDFWTSFGLCFLPILCIYYPLLAFGVDRAKAGDLPPYTVWLGNIVLSVAGLWMIRRVVQR